MPQGYGEAARPVPKIPTSCELFLKGICKDGNLCHYTHNPSDVTRFEMCAEFWISVPFIPPIQGTNSLIPRSGLVC
jgi:hypothetical protein